MFRTKAFYLFLLSIAVPQLAHAYDSTHLSNMQNRPYYGGDIYVAQQLQYGLMNASLSQRSTTSSGLNLQTNETLAQALNSNYQGTALHLGTGVEHFRFIQTGVFYTTAQQNDPKNRSNDLRTQEFGAEAKISLTSPVGNIIFGGGPFASLMTCNYGGQMQNMSGYGFKAGAEFAYFASSKISLSLTADKVVATYKDKSEKGQFASIGVDDTRFGAGLAFWL